MYGLMSILRWPEVDSGCVLQMESIGVYPMPFAVPLRAYFVPPLSKIAAPLSEYTWPLSTVNAHASPSSALVTNWPVCAVDRFSLEHELHATAVNMVSISVDIVFMVFVSAEQCY